MPSPDDLPSPARPIRIEVRNQSDVIQRLSLEPREYLIGRSSSCDIVLDDARIQPRHARLVMDEKGLAVFSLVENIPLNINERKVSSTLLKLEDVITIFQFTIRFVDVEQLARNDPNYYKLKVHTLLIDKMDLRRVNIEDLGDRELWNKCDVAVSEILSGMSLPPELDAEQLRCDVLNEALALGPLEKLLADDTVTEIMVNNKDKIFIERGGKLIKTNLSFTTNEQVINIISRIVNRVGRRIDESTPMVDARLQDGSRVNAVIPPLSLGGPMLDIRKFSRKKFTPENLVAFGSLTAEMIQCLKMAVMLRQNIVISGGTGSGKTSLLNVLSSFIPHDDRVLTIEDSAELQLPHDNLGSLEARPPNVEGKGAVTIRDLVRNALRMRPDRIVVGECRGGETLDMLQAMNTGHDGSLTTLHANSPHDALLRIETMVLMSGLELPVRVIRQQIASAVNLIVQQSRMSDGTRKVTAITAITGIKNDEIMLEDIFIFVREGLDEGDHVRGYFKATGYVPAFVRTLHEHGMELPMDIFKEGRRLR